MNLNRWQFVRLSGLFLMVILVNVTSATAQYISGETYYGLAAERWMASES